MPMGAGENRLESTFAAVRRCGLLGPCAFGGLVLANLALQVTGLVSFACRKRGRGGGGVEGGGQRASVRDYLFFFFFGDQKLMAHMLLCLPRRTDMSAIGPRPAARRRRTRHEASRTRPARARVVGLVVCRCNLPRLCKTRSSNFPPGSYSETWLGLLVGSGLLGVTLAPGRCFPRERDRERARETLHRQPS